jgi:branched-subunit amino acid ABC-type transport system permease component
MISLIAIGIVVIFKGSGVINFSQGAMAMFSAFLYSEARQIWGLNEAAALLIVFSSAILLAAFIDLVAMRPLRNAPMLARVVASLGILLVLEGVATVVFSPAMTLANAVLPGNSLFAGNLKIGSVPIPNINLWLLGLAIVLGGLLWAFYRFTAFGLVTQAAAENPLGALLLGRSTGAVSYVSWLIGCLLATLAGILIAPVTQLSIPALTLLVVPALAAALTGRFSLFGITILTGCLIGMLQSYMTYLAGETGWFEPGAIVAVPFILIIIAMSIKGRLIPGRGEVESRRPPRSPRPSRRAFPIEAGAAYIVIFVLLVTLTSAWSEAITNSIIFAVLAMSVVAVTGIAGQISLAQLSIAGFGAYLTSKLASSAGLPLLLVIPMAGILAALSGAIIGLPALRVRGVNLAVITLSAGVAIEYAVLDSFRLSGGSQGNLVPSPSIFGLSLDSNLHPARFGVLCLTVFFLVLVGVRNIRRSQTGRRDLAMRANERAAAAMGINLTRQKLGAFVFASFIAGIGGSLLAYEIGDVTSDRFTVFDGILLVALVYAGGIGSVAGAIFAGLGASEGVLQHAIGFPNFFAEYAQIVSGALLLLTLATQPDGAALGLAAQVATLRRALSRRRAGRASVPVPAGSSQNRQLEPGGDVRVSQIGKSDGS